MTGGAPRPSAPPKPKVLRTGGGGAPRGGPSLEQLLQKDLEGVADTPRQETQQQRLDQGAYQMWAGRGRQAPAQQAAGGEQLLDRDPEWEANFAKKYPKLEGIEMVETEVFPARTVRDV